MSALGFALVLNVSPLNAQAPRGGTTIEVGHSYSSTDAIRQPATFTVIKEHARPWLTALDAGVLFSRVAGRGWLEAGARASTGSARTRGRRLYGALLRASLHDAPMVLSLAAEYEADGGFDVQKGVVGVEVTPAAVPPLAIGIPRGAFRWRPWLGAGYGNVFSADAAVADVEADRFWRGYLRVEASFEPGMLNVGLEGTSWLVEGGAAGTNYGKGAVSIPLGTSGFSIALTGEVGRQPPRFVYTGRLALGVGFRKVRSE